MMPSKAFLLLLACVLCLAVEACGGESSGGKSSSLPRDAHVAKFRLGHAIGSDGVVVGEGKPLAKGDKVYVSFAIVDAQPNSQARVTWVTKTGGAKMAEESKPLPGGAGVVSFAADTTSWEPGDYVVETWVVEPGARGGRRLGTSDFPLGPARK